MATQVIDNRAVWDKILRELGKLRRTVVTVGVHQDDSARAGDSLTNPQLAAIHEFGAGRIPERSFLRATIDQDRRVEDFAREQAAEVATGVRPASQAGERIGVMTSNAVKTRIRDHIPPPLAAVTIQRKIEKGAHGSGLASMAGNAAAPLIDTGQLINSITYKVKQ
jgi:hypothetical protein